MRLGRPVRDIQGCGFVTATELLCSSDDPSSDVAGTVTALGRLPLESACDGEFEAEGIDYDERDATLRVVVLSPSICVLFDSKTWRFRRS